MPLAVLSAAAGLLTQLGLEPPSLAACISMGTQKYFVMGASILSSEGGVLTVMSARVRHNRRDGPAERRSLSEAPSHVLTAVGVAGIIPSGTKVAESAAGREEERHVVQLVVGRQPACRSQSVLKPGACAGSAGGWRTRPQWSADLTAGTSSRVGRPAL